MTAFVAENIAIFLLPFVIVGLLLFCYRRLRHRKYHPGKDL